MNHRPRFWDELLVALEETLIAYSGLDPELIDAPTMIPKTCHRDSGRSGSSVHGSMLSTGGRNSETRPGTISRGR